MYSDNHLVKRAKVNELSRDYGRFAGHVLTPMLMLKHNIQARVYISKHFPERLVDRDFYRHEDRKFMFKLLSYVFEKKPDDLFEDQDVFVRYKDLTVMLFSEFRDDWRQIRLNTFFGKNENTFMNEKQGRKLKILDVDINDMMNYSPTIIRGTA